REHDGLLYVACADTELGVDDRRIEHEDATLALRRAALRDRDERRVFDVEPEHPRRVLARIPDRRRRAEQHRVRSVKAGNAEETSDDVRDVRAEDTFVRVELVD